MAGVPSQGHGAVGFAGGGRFGGLLWRLGDVGLGLVYRVGLRFWGGFRVLGWVWLGLGLVYGGFRGI